MKRRSFLNVVGNTFPLLYFPSKGIAANDRLQIAAIGVGGKGGSDLQQIARHGELVAACDISDKKLNYALRKFPQAAKFSDYREMISHMGNKIDVLSISTPDHTHAHAAQLAMSQNIHLFIQTPLAHTIWEIGHLDKMANQTRVCTQIGLQNWASDEFRMAVEYLQSGSLGHIEEIHAWTNRPVWPQSPIFSKRPAESQAVPSGLNWDAFIGPAEMRPYHQIYQPYNWRGWRSFGSGALGDVGPHLLSLPVSGCKLSNPHTVSSILSGPVNTETYSAWGIVKFDFNDHIQSRNTSLLWYEGRVGNLGQKSKGKANIPSLDLFLGHTPSFNGCLIRGTKGTMLSPSIHCKNWQVHLGKKWMKPSELAMPTPKFSRNGRGDAGLKDELVLAIRKGQKALALANFRNNKSLNEIIALGNISLLNGGEFKWDSNSGTSDRKDVNARITKPYRKGWEIRSF